MRVALVPSAYEPAVGGVEQLTRRLAAHLMAAGDEVEIWTMRHPPSLPDRAVVDGLVVRRFAFYLPAAHPAALVRFPRLATGALRELRAAASDFYPDVVHVQCFGVNGPYALALARLANLPLVVSLQGETVMDDHDIYGQSISLRTSLRLALRWADAVTACSRFALDDALRRFGPRRGRSQIVFNGVDLEDEVGHLPTPIPGVEPGFVLGLGRIVQKKGFDLLLHAFARLPEDCADASLVIGGDGPVLDDLRALADRLHLGGRVTFPGRLGRDQVSWAMRNAGVFVLPSRVEPFGIVVLEAMRAGRPVVVSDRGGAPEIVRAPAEGLVVDPFDTGTFAATLATVLQDAGLSARLREAGARRVAAFGWPAIASEYRGIYRTVIAEHSGPQPAAGSASSTVAS